MRYFFYDKDFEENKDMFRFLCKQYHPDMPSGNEDMMKQINEEWDTYEREHKKHESGTGHDFQDVIFAFKDAIIFSREEPEDEGEGVMWMGQIYTGTEEEILLKIAIKYGGLSLMEFVQSKEWQDFLNRQN